MDIATQQRSGRYLVFVN